MMKWKKVLIPLVLPFVLSLFPVFMVVLQEEWNSRFEFDREMEGWSDKALSRIEEFKATFRFESQIQSMVTRMQGTIQKKLLETSTKKLTAELLADSFQKNFPISHRPPETLVYGFSLDPGNMPQLLAGQGLSEKKGRVIIRVLAEIFQERNPPAAIRNSINKRLRQLFGDSMSVELMSQRRQGKMIKALFEDKKVMMVWDGITVDNKLVGGYLILFPGDPDKEMALDYSLRHHVLQQRGGATDSGIADIVPVLIPIESAKSTLSPRYSGVESRFPAVGKIINRARSGEKYDRIAPLSLLTRLDPDVILFRTLIAADLPYELWLFKPKTLSTAGTVGWSRTVFLFWCGFWSLGFGLFVRRGKPMNFSMKHWFLSFILLVGGIPLVIFYFLGSYQIDLSIKRQVGEQIKSAQSDFREIDSNSMGLLGLFSNICQEAVQDLKFKEELLSDDLNEEKPGVKHYFQKFSESGIPLDSIFVFQFGRKNIILSPSRRSPEDFDAALNFYMPAMYSIFEFMEPERFAAVIEILGVLQKKILDGYRFIVEPAVFIDLFLLGQKASQYQFGEEQNFQYYQFISRDGQIALGVVFRVKAANAYAKYVKKAMTSLAAVHPNRKISLILENSEGREVFSPGPSKAVNSVGGDSLDSLLQISANMKAGQVSQSRDSAVICHACTHMKNMFLGAEVSFAPIFDGARKDFQRLIAVTLLAFLVMIVLGFAFGHHFLWPLGSIERGIQGLLGKNLDIRLNLTRDDELGDVGEAFDKMIIGLKERHELGRFVSETLNVSVGNSAMIPSEPEIRVGVILASDIRSFTTISETHPAPLVVEMLNTHLDLMSSEIKKQGGMVDKFIGDAIVAVFFGGNPPEVARSAIEAARGMMRQHRIINEKRSGGGKFTYSMGVGIEIGPILLGTYGTADRSEFTVIGDARVAAEELEAKSKLGKFSRIVVSPKIAGICPQIRFSNLETAEASEVVEL